MRPKQQPKARHDDLFRARLDQIINMKHALVALADRIDWAWLDDELAECFSDQGRPAEPVRFMVGMFLLKHTYALSTPRCSPRTWPSRPTPGFSRRRSASSASWPGRMTCRLTTDYIVYGVGVAASGPTCENKYILSPLNSDCPH